MWSFFGTQWITAALLKLKHHLQHSLPLPDLLVTLPSASDLLNHLLYHIRLFNRQASNWLKSMRNRPYPCRWYWGRVMMHDRLYFCLQYFSCTHIQRCILTHSSTVKNLPPGFVQTFKFSFQNFPRLAKTKFQGFPGLENTFSRTFQETFHSKQWLHEVKKCIYKIGYQCICIKVTKRKCNTWGCIIVLQWTQIRPTSSITGSCPDLLTTCTKSRRAALEFQTFPWFSKTYTFFRTL